MTTASRRVPPGRPHRHRAFVATITAVTLLGLTSVAMTAIVAATVADVRRTRQLETDAQFRELLLAGAVDASARAIQWTESPKPHSWDLTLPESMGVRGYHVRLSVETPETPNATDTADVRIEAANAISSKTQIVRFTRVSGKWKMWG